MVIIRNLHQIPSTIENAVVTIGNFDGVHLGHRQIFCRIREAAARSGGVSVVVTFIPHPLKVFPSHKEVRLITTYGEKEGLVEASGIDYLITIPFTVEFAGMAASDFVSNILVGLLHMKRLIIGYDYAFGRNREGNVELLRYLAHKLQFELEVLEPIGDGEETYSSTRIRELIRNGEVGAVVGLLGRHHFIDGTVVHGHHRGKALGFPTANLNTDNELIPKSGVYAVKVKIDERIYDGACNIGSNPTFGDVASAIEVFLFDFSGDLYGCSLRVFFIKRIRDERKFKDPSALQESIRSDVAQCREILSATLVREFHLDPQRDSCAKN